MLKLSDEEKALALQVAETIARVEEAEAWGHFVKAAEAMIEANTPDVPCFDEGKQTYIASKMAFVSGIKACLSIPKNARKRAADLKK